MWYCIVIGLLLSMSRPASTYSVSMVLPMGTFYEHVCTVPQISYGIIKDTDISYVYRLSSEAQECRVHYLCLDRSNVREVTDIISYSSCDNSYPLYQHTEPSDRKVELHSLCFDEDQEVFRINDSRDDHCDSTKSIATIDPNYEWYKI